jgi:putative dimethyl sulfoxide reductase chaperone
LTTENRSADTLELAAAARQRTALYGMLAALINQQPDIAMVQRLRALSLEPMFALVGGPSRRSDAHAGVEAIAAFKDETDGLEADAVARQLAVDWVRLFRGLRRGVGPAPPYESLYVGDAQGTRVVGAVMGAYRRHGTAPCDSVHDQADHLGLELGFVAFLAESEAQAWEAGDEARAADLFRDAEKFLDEHPRRWAGAFCDAAACEAQTAFFRGALLLTKAVLDE